MSAPQIHRYQVLFTDRELTEFVGNPLDQFTELVIIPRFNEPGSAEVTCEAFGWLMLLINTPGTRAAVMRDGVIEVAGLIEVGDFEYDANIDGEDGNGRITFYVADDLALVVGKITYPDPTQAATAQTSARYTITAVNGETAMRALVNLNAGPGALAARQVPGLVLGAAAAVGTNVTYSTRFQPLGNELRALALAAGGLGFKTVQVGLTVEFLVFEPQDTGLRFSRGLGNLRQIRYRVSSPTRTVAIVGGQDAGADRVVRERINTTAITEGHPRIETFVDRRDEPDTTALDTAGDNELDNGQPSIRLGLLVIDTDAQRYRVNYSPGDVADVEVFPGLTVPQVIQAVEIHYTPDTGEVVSPIIGTTDAVTSGPTAALQRAILRQQAIMATAGEIPVP